MIRYTYFKLFFIVLFSINVLMYTYTTAGSFVRSDGWRFIDIYLIPWFENKFEFFMLWFDHHPQPLTALAFIVNAEVFSLNMTYEALFGVFFQVLMSIILLKIYIKSIEKQNLFTTFLFIVLLSILFSLNSSVKYDWSLVALSNIALFLFFVLLYLFDKSEKWNISAFIGFFLATLFLSLIYIDISKIVIATLLVIGFLALVINKKLNSSYMRIILLLFIILVLQKLFLSFIGFQTEYKESLLIGLYDIFYNDFVGFLKSFSIGIANGVLNYNFLKELGFNDKSIELLAFGIMLLYIFTVYQFFNKKYWRYTWAPLSLITFSVLFCIAVIVYRYPPGDFSPYMVASPRNTKFFELGGIGVVWIIGMYIYFESKNSIKYFYMAILLILLSLQVYYVQKQWIFGLYLNKINSQQVKLIQNYEENLSKRPADWIIGGGGFSVEDINFLKSMKLNVFADKYRE